MCLQEKLKIGIDLVGGLVFSMCNSNWLCVLVTYWTIVLSRLITILYSVLMVSVLHCSIVVVIVIIIELVLG